jgi:hypothetical protein
LPFVDELTVGGRRVAIRARRDLSGPVTNIDSSLISTLVLPDAPFDSLLAEPLAADRVQMAFWSGDWKGRQVQAAVIFLVPFLVGLLHSTFAMNALGAVAMRTVLQYGWAVAFSYLPLYGLCSIVTFTLYWRSLKAGLQGGANVH